ncbi:hypothetical protein GEMRC1_005666 [Eukaryota sp. GEM-RC1]
MININIEKIAIPATWTTIILIVIGACLSDFKNNVMKHPKAFQRRRFGNWLLMGITYALSYFGRYSVNILNVKAMWEKYGTSETGYGNIISAAFWVYAIFIIVNGFLVDKLGPRRGVIIGSLGCALSNLAVGAYLQFSPWRGDKWVLGMALLVSVMNYFQTFSACAIVKCGSYWYHQRERGFFGSVFGVLIAFGFFLAFQVNGALSEKVPYQWLFYNPGIALFIMGIVNIIWVKSKPTDIYALDDPRIKNLYDDTFKPSLDSEDQRSFVTMVKPVLTQGIFYVFFLAEFFLGWFRDGILTWFPAYFEHLGFPKDSATYTFSSSGITVGSMFGSLFAGIVSDVFFKSRRQPVAFICCMMVTGLFGVLYYNIESSVFGPLSLGFTAIFYQGIHGILTATCAMDFAGSGSTGIAVGLLDACQKVAASLTGNVMPLLMSDGKDAEGHHIINYSKWVICMAPASFACGILFLLIMGRRATHGKVEKKVKTVDDVTEPLLTAESESAIQSHI